MRPEIRGAVASTALVIVYPIMVMAVLTPFGILQCRANVERVLDALWMPLDLPSFLMRSLHPSEHVGFGRVPIENALLVLGWFIAFNAILYYIPIRLLLEWREQKIRLI